MAKFKFLKFPAKCPFPEKSSLAFGKKKFSSGNFSLHYTNSHLSRQHPSSSISAAAALVTNESNDDDDDDGLSLFPGL
jgi:orotate phosphoribosyltransferase